MASIETLINQIDDATLRDLLAREVAELKATLSWGLVFEQHLPERARLLSAPVRPGTVAWERRSAKPRRFRVRDLEGDRVTVVEEAENTTAPDDAATIEFARGDILVEHDFAQPVFPTLRSIERPPDRGPADRPTHIVINGENYDALEVLMATNAADFDVIYLDPPYNTGAKEWSYNNDFVDPADTWRSSKWLAFMNRRLRLARRLLRPDGVLIVTIDEHEVHHLGMLLEQVFPDYLRQVVTIVINPKGTGKLNFARVEEYAFFLMPNLGRSVVHGLPKPEKPARRGAAAKQQELPLADPILEEVENEAEEEEEEAVEGVEEEEEEDLEAAEAAGLPFPEEERHLWELRHARRRGGESSYRPQRPNQFYRIWIDPKERKVVRADTESLPIEDHPDLTAADGLVPVWPIDKESNERCWRYIPRVMNDLIAANRVVLGKYNAKTGSWTINYWTKATGAKKPKTVWWETRYDAGTHGTSLVNTFLGSRRAFSFPKSVYAVADCLAMVVRERPNAKILDFFAGSGTTLHATWLLNQQYPGNRQCVLVTNNELNYKAVGKLHKGDHFRGDPEFEAEGVFQAATRPRVKAALSGKKPNGDDVKGKYLDGRKFADGFPENVEFFELDYLDGAEVEFGLRFAEIEPLLWLQAGGNGPRPTIDPAGPFAVPAGSTYAVLFGPAGVPGLAAALAERRDVTHVFIVADSAATYAQLASELLPDLTKVWLYHDYLEAVRSATR